MPILDAHALDSDPDGCAFLRSVLRDDWNRATTRSEKSPFQVTSSEPQSRIEPQNRTEATAALLEAEHSEFMAPA